MLQAIREKVTGWIAYGIIFLISIPFALWGVNSYLGGGEALPAATINGAEITTYDLDQAYANYRQRLSQLFGGTIPETFGSEATLRAQVLDQLIEEYALRQYIDEQRYRIGDDELNRSIRGMDAFKTDGQFDAGVYEAQLRSLGYSPIGFEQELRMTAAMEQFQNGIRATAFTLPVTQQKFTRLNKQTRQVRTVSYRAEPDSIEIEDDEILALYESRQDHYRIPKKVKIDYIELSLDSVKDSVEVSQDDVLARYEDNIAVYTSPEIREASHILIKIDAETNSDDAETRIRQIRDRIDAGGQFADLARELSEDPGSADDGGNLGEIERGVMVQAFEAALFSMQVDQLSEPVKTGFGWHLIKLHAISGGETQAFETLQSTLADELRSEIAESRIYDLVENLANIAYEESGSLAPGADQLDLKLQTSDWFERYAGDGIAAEQVIRDAAFSADVMERGLNSEAIELGSERVVFLRLNELKEASQQPFESVKGRVEAAVREKKLREKNQAQGEQALARLKNGGSMDDVALEWSTTVTDYGFVNRQQSGIESVIRSTVFTMAKPEQGVNYEGVLLNNGDYVIVELAGVEADQSETKDDQEALDALTEAQGENEYQAVLKLLTSRADVFKTLSDEF